jgi:hypothetical protein
LNEILHNSEQVKKEFNVIMKTSNTGKIQLKEYNRSFYKVPAGWQKILSEEEKEAKSDILIKKLLTFEKSKAAEVKTISLNSLTRTRNSLIEYSIENKECFKCFITLTFADNVKDLSIANKEFHKYIN